MVKRGPKPTTCPHGVLGIGKCLTCQRERNRQKSKYRNTRYWAGERARKRRFKDDMMGLVEYVGFCQVCGIDPNVYPQGPQIDHDHTSSCHPGNGYCPECVRGVLCSPCNTALGLAEDSPAILQAMIRYLREGHRANMVLLRVARDRTPRTPEPAQEEGLF